MCEDIDFCCSCFPGGVKVESHTDDHALVHLRFKCDGCHALIVGTRMHCTVCDDFDLCYGCHQTKNYPSRHKDHHIVTPIPMIVASQYKSQPQAYTQLHAWLLFSSFTLSLAETHCKPLTDNEDVCPASSMLQTCVDLILVNLSSIAKQDQLSPVVSTSQEKVFTEKTFEKLLGLLASLLPGTKFENDSLIKMLKVEKLLPLLFRFARETTGQYVPTQHLAIGLIGKLLGRVMPKFADECLLQTTQRENDDIAKEKNEGQGEEKKNEESIEMDVVAGVKSIQFICYFGANCLEKCHLEWAALLPHLLIKLSTKTEWREPITKVLSSSFSQLPDHCSLSTIFTLFTTAGFPEVFGHGSQAIYQDSNHEKNDVMILKHFLQNGQVYIVDNKTRKTKHVAEDQLDLKSINSQPLTSDQLLTFLDISKRVMIKLKEGTENLSVESMWVLYLVLKTLHANFKPHFFEHIPKEFLHLLSFVANSQTGLSRHWLLKDLEILSIQLYTNNQTDDSIVQPLLDVSADFHVHVHRASTPQKSMEEIILDVKLKEYSSESTSSGSGGSGGILSDDGTTSSDSDEKHPIPHGASIPITVSGESDGSEDSEYHSVRSEKNEMEKVDLDPKNTNTSTKSDDPLSELDDNAKLAILSTHEAFKAPLSVLRALYEIYGKSVENFVQQASRNFQGDSLNVSDNVLLLAKSWESQVVPTVEVSQVTEPVITDNKIEAVLPRWMALPEPTQLMTSLISHGKQEMKERYRKHQREKSKDLLIKELEKHGKVGTREYIYKINHVLSIMYARNLLISLLADWPDECHMTISENLGCKEPPQLLSMLDLLQRTAEEEIYKKIIGVVVQRCSSDILNHLCQAACSFMQEMALQPKIIESKHNYDNDTKKEGNVCLSGARYLLIKFDERCCTEDCCDILTIASDAKFKHNVRAISGPSSNWTNFDIPGDTLYYKFVSDFNNNEWGYKFTVIGNHVGRFETGFLLLDSVLPCSNLLGLLSLTDLWAHLIKVCNKQVGLPRLKSIRLLLRILQYISSDEKDDADADSPKDDNLPVDLTLLKPLWLLLNQMNNQLSEDTTTCQSIHASHSALTELFYFVENLVMSRNQVENYILALTDETEIARSLKQGLCNVAAIGRAINIPNKASLLLYNPENSTKPVHVSPENATKPCYPGMFSVRERQTMFL